MSEVEDINEQEEASSLRKIFNGTWKCLHGVASSCSSFFRTFMELESHYLGSHVRSLYSTRHGDIDKDKKAIEAANLPVLWILGGPGAPIQAFVDRLARMYNFHHIYIGDTVTQEISLGTGRADVAQQLMYRGMIIPRAFLIEIMKRDMVEAISINDVKGFLFSDYPYTHDQAKNFVEKVSSVDFVVVLKFTEITMHLNAFHLFRAQSYSSQHLRRNKDQLRQAAENEVKCYLKNLNLISKEFGKKIKVVDAKLQIKEVYSDLMKLVKEASRKHDKVVPKIDAPPVQLPKPSDP